MVRKNFCFLALIGLAVTLSNCQEDGEEATPILIASISPTSGPKGQEVEIIGTGFSTTAADNAVTFNGKAALVVRATSTKLVVKVASKAGTGAVVVTAGGQSVTGPVFSYVFTVRVATFAGSDYGYADGTRSGAKFKWPQGLAFDSEGNLYVADRSDNRIRKITSDATVTTVAGSGSQGSNDGSALSASFFLPYDVTFDRGGNMYVADKTSNYIRKMTPAGIVSKLAGSGFNEWKDGTGTGAGFNNPTSIVIDASENLYVLEEQNSVIRKVSLNGVVTTFSGRPQTSTDGTRFRDGAADVARFNLPSGIAIDKQGIMYVADRENNRIRKVAKDGSVTTIAGTGEFGYKDGPGAEAQFALPNGIDVDWNGNIFVADSRNHNIRMITPEGVVSTIAGNVAVTPMEVKMWRSSSFQTM